MQILRLIRQFIPIQILLSQGSQTLQEKLTHYHKRLNSSESEGRVMQEKLATLQQNHCEQEDLVARLQDRIANLQNSLTDNEVRVLLKYC